MTQFPDSYRPYLKVWRDLATLINIAHPGRDILNGMADPAGPSQFIDNHPRAWRVALVKFLPVVDQPARVNHGMGVDFSTRRATLLVRSWGPRQSIEHRITEPSLTELADLLVSHARTIGLLK